MDPVPPRQACEELTTTAHEAAEKVGLVGQSGAHRRLLVKLEKAALTDAASWPDSIARSPFVGVFQGDGAITLRP